MIFSRGFKQYNNTLLNIRIQTGLSSGHFKRLLVPLQRPKSRWSLKYFEILPKQLRGSKTLEKVL